jgi:GntR family transcriptional regulator / MocR family aminotransferase
MLRVEGVAAGVHLLARLPLDVVDSQVVEVAAERGVRVEALSTHALSDAPSSGLVLGYGRLHERAIPAAVRELAHAVRRCQPPGN